MPNDENTQQIQQNQNPVVDPNVSANSGNSDDFDFSFASDLDSGVSNNQSQMVGQGRTGMFLTPDEEAEKEELKNSGQPVIMGPENVSDEDPALGENNGSYFPNVNVNNNVEAENNDTKAESSSVETDNSNENPDVDVDSPNDKFDDKIENLISFDDDGPTSVSESLQNVDVSYVADAGNASENNGSDIDSLGDSSLILQEVNQDQVKSEDLNTEDVETENIVEDSENNTDSMENNTDSVENNTDSVENNIDSMNNNTDSMENNTDSVENNIDSMENNTDSMENNTDSMESNIDSMNNNEGGDNTPNDDWLQQEDKKVEETFGQENVDNNQEMEVNKSPVDVAQNVENLLNSAVSNNDNLSGQIDINNAGSDNIVLPDGLGNVSNPQQVNEQYVPNEAEFSAMSNLLNSSGVGQVDLRNVGTESEDNFGLGSDISALNNSNVDLSQNQGNGVGVNVNNSFGDTVNAIQDSANTVSNMVNSIDPQMDEQVVGVSANQNIDLNSTGVLGGDVLGNTNNMGVVENQGVSLDTILDQEIQNMHIQPQNVEQINNSGVTNMNPVQPQNLQVQAKKRKKQSGFLVLGIVGGIIALGVLGYFVAAKMFPDKLKNLFKGDVVVEYLAGNENNNDTEGVVKSEGDQNMVDEGYDLEKPDEQELDGEMEDNNELEEELGDNVEGNDVEGGEDENGGEEELDPNSLAGLLSEDGNTVENGNVSENGDSVDNDGGQNSQESNVDITDDGNTNGDDFNPYAEIDSVISGVSDSDKLNEYIEQGNYYKELGVTNNDKKMERYGEYIVVTATEELGKLENGEEIDNTIFSKLDEILESLK